MAGGGVRAHLAFRGGYGADMEGLDKVCSTIGTTSRQMMLPLRHGGLGLHMQ